MLVILRASTETLHHEWEIWKRTFVGYF